MAAYGQLQKVVAPLAPMTEEMITFAPKAGSEPAFRRALGCFGTGVTIVTIQSERGPVGMTVNSFSSVSLNPPLILWAPAHKSQRHDAFVAAKHFCVHVLAAEQQELASLFAREAEQFHDVDWTPDGKRFAIFRSASGGNQVEVKVILNWFEEIEAIGKAGS